MFSTSVDVESPLLTSSKLHNTLFWLAVQQAERNLISLSIPSRSRWDSRRSHNCIYLRTGRKLPRRTSQLRGEGMPLFCGRMEFVALWLSLVPGRSQEAGYYKVVCGSGRRTWHSRKKARQEQMGRKSLSKCWLFKAGKYFYKWTHQ